MPPSTFPVPYQRDTALHATLAPSSAFIWAPVDGCKGQVQFVRRYPVDTESQDAREGTAAHWYVSETLHGRVVTEGMIAPNAEPITAEMIEAGRLFIDDINRTRAQYPGAVFHVEQRVAMTCVHAECWGTPDAFLFDARTGMLIVWDYKYGHRYIDPFRNWQLILYAIGVLEMMGLADWQPYRCTLRIVQPRNYHPTGHIREWYLSGFALLDYVKVLRVAAFEVMSPGAELHTGNHCRDCDARHGCPALMRAAALSIDIAYQQTPMDLTPAALGLELRYLTDAEARLKARRAALEEQVLGMMRAGKDVPLWRADYSSGRERWTKTPAEVFALGDLFGVDLRQEIKPVTPAQARALGIDKTVTAGFAETPRGSMKLVALTDDSVAKAFGE